MTNSPKEINWFGSLILLLRSLTAFGPLSIDMYLPAFGDIARAFSTTLDQVQLSLASFFFGIVFGQLLYGPTADRFGRRKPFFFGLSVYCVASLFCSFATTVDQLVIARFFQALGACAGMVIARA